jgi:hypothetical protein
MLPRRAAARSARLSAVVAGADLRRVGRADRVVAVMRGCPNHPTVFTMHPSGICAICRAAADAGPTAIAPPYSIPAGCQEEQQADDYTADDLIMAKRKYPWNPEARAAYLRMCVAMRKPAEWTTPPDNCIPESARRILDMGRTQQAVPVPQQPVDERSAGVARAVANLSNHEHRLGASRWEP